MNGNNHRNQEGMGSFMAGMLGMAIGAIAATAWMSDKKNQQKIQHKIQEMKEKFAAKKHDVNEEMAQKAGEIEDKARQEQYKEEFEK